MSYRCLWMCVSVCVWSADRRPHYSCKLERSADIYRWAVECCHRCLVYLGDLGRSLLASRAIHDACNDGNKAVTACKATVIDI